MNIYSNKLQLQYSLNFPLQKQNKCSIIYSNEYENIKNNSVKGGRVHMDKEQRLQEIRNMLKMLDDSDSNFIWQIYTIIRRHLIKKGKL